MGPDLIIEAVRAGPEALFSTAMLMLVAAVLTAHSKAVIRPLFNRFVAGDLVRTPGGAEDPWRMIAVLYGIVLAWVASTSAHGPEWLIDAGVIVIYGLVVGIGASAGRDVVMNNLAGALGDWIPGGGASGSGRG